MKSDHLNLSRLSIYTKEQKEENENNRKLKINLIPSDIWMLVCSFLDTDHIKPVVTLILTCRMFYNKFYQNKGSAKELFFAKLFRPIINLNYLNRSFDWSTLIQRQQFSGVLLRVDGRMGDVMNFGNFRMREEVNQPGENGRENGFIMRGVYRS